MATSDPFLERAIAHVRNFAMDTIDEVRFPKATIAELIDTANSLVFGEMLASCEPKTHFRLSEATISISSAADEYDWPANVRRYMDLIKKDSTGRIIDRYNLTSWNSGLPGIILLDEQRGFRIVPPPQNVSVESWTLVYEAGVTPYLCYGTAAAGGSTTITLANPTASQIGTLSVEDQFYTNSYIRIVSGTGAGQERRITGYVGSTKVATVARAWGTNPDNTSVFEIMPCLKHPLDKAIMWRTAMMMKASDADRVHRLTAEEEFQAVMREVLMKVANRQSRVGPSMNSEFMELFDYGVA